VILDGSGSSDPDSTPGTNDDIVLFEWIEDLGLPSERSLGTGATLTVELGLGVHDHPRATDSSGESATDTVAVSVIDSTPPNLSVSLEPSLLWPPNHRLVDVAEAVARTLAARSGVSGLGGQ
jgi:hypothetical protein